MPTQNVARLAFNRGQVSPLALARTDIDRIELSAEEQTNFVPRVLGSMMLRPGLKYVDTTLSNNYAQHIPFVFATDDKAVIEMTNLSMRVRVDDEIIERDAVSTVTRGGDFASENPATAFTKISDPSTLPDAATTTPAVGFSPDGQYFVAGDAAGNGFRFYSVSGTTFTPLSNASWFMTGGAVGTVAWSPDSANIALAHATTPFIEIGYISSGSGATAVFDDLADPASLPAGNATGCAWSPNGQFLAVSHTTTPFVTIYEVSGTGASATFTKLSNPASLPAGDGKGVTFSADNRFMAVAHATTPFVTIYEINGTTFTKLSDPASLPAAQGNGVAFSRDGLHMAVAHTTTPFVTIYSISDTTFTKLSNPSTLPDGNGQGVAFSTDNQFLSVAHTTTQFVTIYRYVSGVWTKQTDPATLPAGNAHSTCWSDNNRFMVVGHTTTPFITIYEAYQWLDMDETGTSSTYGGVSPASFEDSLATLTMNSTPTVAAGATGYTFRVEILAGALTRTGDKVKLTFKAHTAPATFGVDKVYIGKKAASGSAYDFASAPTAVTFSGNPGFVITDDGTITSDEIVFDMDGSAIIVSFHIINGSNDEPDAKSDTSANLTTYQKSGDDAATVNATGYALSSRDSVGLTRIQVLDIEDGGTGLFFNGTLYSEAKRVQAVSVLNADKAVEHALNITVQQGDIKLRIGTTYGEEDLVRETTLTEGSHSIAFTPNANLFFIQFSSNTIYSSILTSCQIASPGDMTLDTPYEEDELNTITFTQSADVIYLACMDNHQMKIERRAARSWSIVKYLPKDGPFRSLNTNSTTITPSALTGDITLSASRDIFRETHVGALFKVKSSGQNTSDSFTGANQFSAVEVRVTGSGTQRSLSITRSGTWSATITLQRSLAAPGSWIDVATFTTNGTSTYTDDLDNQIAYYRIGIKTGNYTSGTAVVAMGYASGGIDGIARVTAYNSRSNVDAIVLAPFGSTSSGSENWKEGTWSDFRGWPSAVVLYEGRLVWAGKDRVVLSKSDDYENFDESTEGDSAPMNRTIGLGPVDRINWAVYSKTLILGGQDAEFSIGTTSFDEVLTPTNYHCDPVTNVGSSTSFAAKLDKAVIFAARTGTKLYQLDYNSDIYDYQVKDLSQLVPDICDARILKMVYQRYPDTRMHCVLGDGTVAMMIYEPIEQVNCWLVIETDGDIEDVVVLPGDVGEPEDHVYYVVKRTVNGAEVRYYERWALEQDCQGGTLNKQADAFLEYSGVSTATITGLDHLEGEEVVAWGDGLDLGTYTVSGGSITLSQAVSGAIVGLPYTARYKSTKLAYAAAQGTALTFNKALHQTGLILYNTHRYGLQIGDSFDYLDDLPSEGAEGAFRGDDDIIASEDLDLFSINRNWSTDSRLCLEASAPRPVTILCVVMNIQTNG
jgi:hypothetical protein